jgi:hypothetical protein
MKSKGGRNVRVGTALSKVKLGFEKHGKTIPTHIKTLSRVHVLGRNFWRSFLRFVLARVPLVLLIEAMNRKGKR